MVLHLNPATYTILISNNENEFIHYVIIEHIIKKWTVESKNFTEVESECYFFRLAFIFIISQFVLISI